MILRKDFGYDKAKVPEPQHIIYNITFSLSSLSLSLSLQYLHSVQAIQTDDGQTEIRLLICSGISSGMPKLTSHDFQMGRGHLLLSV